MLSTAGHFQVMMKSQVALLYVLIIMSEGSAKSLNPRRSVFFSDVKLKLFKEPDFSGLSSMLVREDIGLLFIGARGKVITLSLNDITKKTSEINWTATSEKKSQCVMKGESIEDCDNYITMMHTLDDGRILVCGTKAFDPTCTHLIVNEGRITMEDTTQTGKGTIPFNPKEKFASMMNGDKLYTAGTTDWRGTAILFQRHGKNYLRNEFDESWFKNPMMISMHMVEMNKVSENNEDDNMFLFLSEEAIEERHKLRLSRVARVCKSDLGGEKNLQKKWTSFLKARLDCPFGDIHSQSLVQDVFLLRDENNLKDIVFYATFTSNLEPSSSFSQSAVCAYKLSDIQQVFRGNFLTLSDSGCWVKYTGTVPKPYPGSCIIDETQTKTKDGKTSRHLNDTIVDFVREHHLMEGAVTPITERPLLVRSAAQFSRIVVDKVTSLDGQQHIIMLIGNNSGWLQKVVWPDDGGRIIEELQLFQDPQPIHFLQLSSRSGQLYSATRTAVAQLSLRDCSRYKSCDDCLIARDPYCGWDRLRGLCAAVAGASKSSMIQNLIDGNVGICSSFKLSKPITDIHLTVDVAQFLPCSPDTNLPISWSFSGHILEPGPRHILLSQGLVLTPSSADVGLYTCETVEVVKGREHRKAVIQYNVKISLGGVNWIQALFSFILAFVCVLCLIVISYLCWKQKTRNHVGSTSVSDASTEKPKVKTGSYHYQLG